MSLNYIIKQFCLVLRSIWYIRLGKYCYSIFRVTISPYWAQNSNICIVSIRKKCIMPWVVWDTLCNLSFRPLVFLCIVTFQLICTLNVFYSINVEHILNWIISFKRTVTSIFNRLQKYKKTHRTIKLFKRDNLKIKHSY